ncbi:DUF11 domain-containing protein [Anatilimnocola floriformis]|uniref:DUF11 domain-containing protein n=1 Tax=Anatilimnocola floriformis TaxID=2948575 RepID=UPI0020C507ED|nr:DUF11 domain-containing protein [Anatilimnocola floriformis]
MKTQLHIAKLAGVLTATALCALGGCAIPAFDRTGERVFAGTTQLASVKDCPLLAHHQQPAPGPAPVVPPAGGLVVGPAGCGQPPPLVVAPPPPPAIIAVPMTPAACAAPVPTPRPCQVQPTPLPVQQCAAPLPANSCDNGPQLKITPNRIVAPVGSEVVLTAGICGTDGYLVMRQPIEWMLAQDGAGQIVAIGQESPHHASYFLRNSPQKVTPQYALAHTSTISQCVDRGTKDPSDDIQLQKGQSWISVTSPKEGASYVTVWSPKEHNFDRRRAQATIYWVDAVWNFPPCAVATIGSRTGHQLRTVVKRSGGPAVAGWIVRYEVLDGPEANFGGGNARVVDVRTDSNGVAVADLMPRTNSAGITTVRVQILRPASGDLPDMIVGQSTTSVSWSAPGLSVSAVGPTTIPGDGLLSYEVAVNNTGDQATQGVVLKFTPPSNVTVLNSSPSAEMYGNRLEWRIGDLQARGRASVKVNCRAAVDGDLRSTFMAVTSDGNLKAEGTAATRVFRQALAVRMNGPDAVEVGKRATFQIEITNTGSEVLRNVTLTDRFPAELVHADGQSSPIVKTIGDIQPGQKISSPAVTFIVTRPGQHSHRLDVTADGNQSATARGVVTGIQSQIQPARLQLRLSQPQQVKVGETGELIAEVTNVGGSLARNAKLSISYSPNFAADRATPGHQVDEARRTLTWTIDQLAAGAVQSRQLNLRGVAADDRAFAQITVTPENGQPETRQVNITITGGGRAAPVPVPMPMPMGESPMPMPQVPQPRVDTPRQPPRETTLPAGNLEVSLSQSANPIPQGGTTRYLVRIKNDASGADDNLQITLVLPDGLKFKRLVSGDQKIFQLQDATAGVVTLTPIALVRAREELPTLQIEVEGAKPGMHTFQVELRSKRNTKPITRERTTTVNMPSAPR